MKSGTLGSLLPRSRQISDTHRLLLAAALLPPSEAITAWNAFRSRVDIRSMDRASNALASLLYCNLLRANVEAAEMTILKGVYRYQWTRSTLALRTAVKVVNELTSSGFVPFLVHDVAIAHRFYMDAAGRSAGAVTIFLPGGGAIEAAKHLATRGWVADAGAGRQHYWLRSVDQFDVDLRDSLMFDSAIPIPLLIEREVRFELEPGTEARGLDAADELIAAVLRVVGGDGPPLVALADCATLILHPELVAERLARRVDRFGLAWPLDLVCRELASIGLAEASSLLARIGTRGDSAASHLEFRLRARGRGRLTAHAADWLRTRRARKLE